jgi:hypothetical protein
MDGDPDNGDGTHDRITELVLGARFMELESNGPVYIVVRYGFESIFATPQRGGGEVEFTYAATPYIRKLAVVGKPR